MSSYHTTLVVYVLADSLPFSSVRQLGHAHAPQPCSNSGHATRVVALTHELLLRSHRVYICTNAPEHVFYSAIKAGASYRHAEIDAGIVQPKAYDVARRKTIEGLTRFLDAREEKLNKEVDFLRRIKADAVLVDAPFLPW